MTAAPLPGYLAGHATDLATLQERVALDRWYVNTGQKDELAVGQYPDCGWLTDGTLVARALELGDRTLAHELVLWYFRITLAGATTRLRRAERTTTTELDGETLTYGQLAARARGAGTAEQRASAADALARVSACLRRARRDWLSAHAQARKRLGFAGHGDLVRALHPDADQAAGHARRWLADTRADYLQQAQQWRQRDALHRATLGNARLIGARAALPAAAAPPLASARASLRAWGFGDALDHVLIDDSARPGKAGFAFCSPVRPPVDVRVSVASGTTLPHYLTTLHELGHALHFTVGVTGPAEL